MLCVVVSWNGESLIWLPIAFTCGLIGGLLHCPISQRSAISWSESSSSPFVSLLLHEGVGVGILTTIQLPAILLNGAGIFIHQTCGQKQRATHICIVRVGER